MARTGAARRGRERTRPAGRTAKESLAAIAEEDAQSQPASLSPAELWEQDEDDADAKDGQAVVKKSQDEETAEPREMDDDGAAKPDSPEHAAKHVFEVVVAERQVVFDFLDLCKENRSFSGGRYKSEQENMRIVTVRSGSVPSELVWTYGTQTDGQRSLVVQGKAESCVAKKRLPVIGMTLGHMLGAMYREEPHRGAPFMLRYARPKCEIYQLDERNDGTCDWPQSSLGESLGQPRVVVRPIPPGADGDASKSLAAAGHVEARRHRHVTEIVIRDTRAVEATARLMLDTLRADFTEYTFQLVRGSSVLSCKRDERTPVVVNLLHGPWF